MKVLTRYSKEKNVTNIENVSQKEYIQNLETKNASKPIQDLERPFTFKEWYERSEGIIVDREIKQYDDYVKKWYANLYTPLQSSSDVKDAYIDFIKEITLVLNKNKTENWLNDVNWDSSIEVQQVIPFCAKKLKEISIYLQLKRDTIKNAKLKYNLYGSMQGIEKPIREYILKNFAKRPNTLRIEDEEFLSLLPDLSAVKDQFKVVVEELYDDGLYFDKVPNLSASYAFNDEVNSIYETLGIPQSAYSWAFNTGVFELCANTPLFWSFSNILINELPLSAFDLESKKLIEELKFEISKKYLGEEQFYVLSGYYIPWLAEVSNDLGVGNTWFYWPSGNYFDTRFENITLDSLTLSATNLIDNGAFGAKNYVDADKIFIRYGNTVEGAWLKSTKETTQTENMSCYIDGNNSVSFTFPFAGYGLSGVGLEWTGKQLSNLDKSFLLFDESLKQGIIDEYWSTTITLSSITPINIHDTTLIENFATPGLTFDSADTIWQSTSSNNVKKYAWLYKFLNSDIPIVRGKNYIKWPIQRYDVNDSDKIPDTVCNSINISAFGNIMGSRAGHGLYDSDIVYKLNSKNGYPIECAFLSGTEISTISGSTFTSNATGVIQSSLALRCNPDQYATFIWCDEDININSLNIKNVEHQPDCKYRAEEKFSLLDENPSEQKENIKYDIWKTCDCKAINYSPLGHNGDRYDMYTGFADIVFLDNTFPDPFSFTTWRDMSGNDYRTSNDFAWYQVTGTMLEPGEVGYGAGRWVAGNEYFEGRTFQFKKGQQYKYLRAGLRYDATFLVSEYLPFMIIKHDYNNIITWKKAIQDGEGNWVETVSASDMVINANDYIVYDHIDSNWYCVTSEGNLGVGLYYNTTAMNVSSNPWITFDYITSGQNTRLLWPNTLALSSGPTILSYQLSSVTWRVKTPNNYVYTYKFNEDQPLTIVGDTLGLWRVTAIGHYLTAGDTPPYRDIANFYVSDYMVTSALTGANVINTIYTDTINTNIVERLSGWNYDEYSEDYYAYGAKPFWAKGYDTNVRITKFKGIDVYGGGIQVYDEYTLISQPEISDMIFNINDKVDIYAKGNLLWLQPVQFITNIDNKQWCELVMTPDVTSTLVDFIYNNPLELVVDAKNTPSYITFESVKNGYPVLVNYWGNTDFTWNQQLSSSSLGIPPTGGIFVPYVSGSIHQPYFPYANILNKHYPSVASIPDLSLLYSEKQSGGYLLPKGLGFSTVVAKSFKNLFTSNGRSADTTGLSAIYFDPTLYGKLKGVSEQTFTNSISTIDSNSEWMKHGSNNYYNAGTIVNRYDSSTFIPYQNNYDSFKVNSHGIYQQTDEHDPWYGVNDDEWKNPTYWPPNFRDEYNHEEWYENRFLLKNKEVYTWKSDIFGHNFALVKSISAGMGIYEKKMKTGDIYVRDTDGMVLPIEEAFSGFYNILSSSPILSSVYTSIVGEKIIDMDIWFDTIMYYSSSYIVLNKIYEDYSNEGNTTINDFNIISLSADQGGMFGGYWVFDDQKEVILTNIIFSGSIITPSFKRFNINNNSLKNVELDMSGQTIINSMSSVSLSEIEQPVLTYNNNTNIMNMAFVGYSLAVSGMYLGVMNFKDNINDFTLNNYTMINPMSSI